MSKQQNTRKPSNLRGTKRASRRIESVVKEQKQRTIATGKTLRERALATAPGLSRCPSWDTKIDKQLLSEINDLLTAWDTGDGEMRNGFASLNALCRWIAGNCEVGVNEQAVYKYAKQFLNKV